MLTYILNSKSKIPLYEQLYRFIRRDIEQGKLKADQKLPSKRQLSSHLKISVITVGAAYSQLIAEGYITSRPKSGFYINKIDHNFNIYNNYNKNKENYNTNSINYHTENLQEYKYDFKTNVVDTTQFPFDTWARLTREVLSERSAQLLSKTDPLGIYGLRQQIADYLYSFRGIKTKPEQIIIGAGSEYLTGLIIQLLGRKNIYGVENPGYHKTAKIFATNDVKTNYHPMDNYGVDMNYLINSDTNIIHITPSHHFPLGIVMPITRRAELLNWAMENDNRYIIEDDYDSEFRFSGRPIPALQSLDKYNKVIYMNTFAKSLAPSFRISYMVLPIKLLECYLNNLLFYSSTVPVIEQLTLAKFIEKGYFERHISRMRNIYKLRRDFLINEINNSNLGKICEIKGQDSGLHLLIKINNHMNEKALIKSAIENNVRVYGLSEYYFGNIKKYPHNTVIMGYSGMDLSEIKQAIICLNKAWCK